jgi:hypothetical protein
MAARFGGWGRYANAAQYWFCPQCGDTVADPNFEETADAVQPETHGSTKQGDDLVRAALPKAAIQSCLDHAQWPTAPNSVHRIKGLAVQRDFMTVEEEARVVHYFDGAPVATDSDVGTPSRWIPSQSGRRKMACGPHPNFKKRKVKCVAERGGTFPLPVKFLIDRAAAAANTHPTITATPDAQNETPFVMGEFSALDYDPRQAANLDPHVDDEWLWGSRILGLCFLSDAVMTFIRDGACVDAVLPRRAWFAFTGEARHQWLHGVAARNVPLRRVSITLRELSMGFRAENPDMARQVDEMGTTFA